MVHVGLSHRLYQQDIKIDYLVWKKGVLFPEREGERECKRKRERDQKCLIYNVG